MFRAKAKLLKDTLKNYSEGNSYYQKKVYAKKNAPGYASGLNFLELAKKWPLIVGSYLGDKSIPIKLKNAHLTLVVKHQIYAQEIRFIEKEIVKKISASFPNLGKEILKINFIVKDNFSLNDYFFHTDSNLETDNKKNPFKKIHPKSPLYKELEFEASKIFDQIESEEVKKLLVELFFQNHSKI